MPSIAERHRQARQGKGPLRPSEVARLREELEGLKARSAEIEAKLDIVPPWRAGETFEVDDEREYDGTVYRAITGHTNHDPNHTPDLTPALWEPQ